jgi:hypothetical protein
MFLMTEPGSMNEAAPQDEKQQLAIYHKLERL